MITETSAVNFRQNLGEMLNQVQYRRDSVVITGDKDLLALAERYPIAALGNPRWNLIRQGSD